MKEVKLTSAAVVPSSAASEDGDQNCPPLKKRKLEDASDADTTPKNGNSSNGNGAGKMSEAMDTSNGSGGKMPPRLVRGRVVFEEDFRD